MNAERIIAEVAARHCVSVGELRSRSRMRELTLARIEAAQRLRVERKLSYAIIGRLLGGRSLWTAKYLADAVFRSAKRAQFIETKARARAAA